MAEPVRETWIQWVALTTTVLAVCAAISTLKATGYSTKVQLYTTKEANQWAYFQAKSIKEHSFRLNRDVLGAVRGESKSPQVQKFLNAKIKEYDGEIARYDKEKGDIKAEAENIIAQEDLFKKHNAAFALAVMLLQIAIMMSAVGALIKKKIMWLLGLVMGLWGLTYMINGFFLWF
jgi:hypothetical protein